MVHQARHSSLNIDRDAIVKNVLRRLQDQARSCSLAFLGHSMRYIIKSLISAALVAAATPSMAATIVFSDGGTGVSSGDVIFTAGTGSEAVQVRASAWTLNGNTVSASTLGVYSNGLGVTNGNEGSGGGNSHTIDNLNGIDFIVLQFDKKVSLSDATFAAYQQTGYSYTDTDATIGYGTTATAWNSSLNLVGNVSLLNALVPTSQQYSIGNVGTQGTNTTNIDPLLYSGNVWIVSASMANPDNKYDSFKLNYLNYTTKMPVPEPATWMMMISGFGMIGSTMRRRKSVIGTVEATS